MLFSTGTDGVDDSLFKSMNYEIYVEYFLMVTVCTPPGQLLPPWSTCVKLLPTFL